MLWLRGCSRIAVRNDSAAFASIPNAICCAPRLKCATLDTTCEAGVLGTSEPVTTAQANRAWRSASSCLSSPARVAQQFKCETAGFNPARSSCFSAARLQRRAVCHLPALRWRQLQFVAVSEARPRRVVASGSNRSLRQSTSAVRSIVPALRIAGSSVSVESSMRPCPISCSADELSKVTRCAQSTEETATFPP